MYQKKKKYSIVGVLNTLYNYWLLRCEQGVQILSCVPQLQS